MIDITHAVSHADLTENNVIADSANLYQLTYISSSYLQYGQPDHTIKVCYSPRNANVQEPIQSNIVYTAGRVITGLCFTYNASNIQDGKILNYYYITEPIQPGAHGVRINKNIENHSNYFFSSGRLSGCTCAILKRNDDIFFIHSGATITHADQINDVVLRRKIILRDLYNCVLQMEGFGRIDNVEGISINELLYLLNEFGFSGTLVTRSEIKKSYLAENISVYEYDPCAVQNAAGYCNMIVAIDERGRICTGVRSFANSGLSVAVGTGWVDYLY